jgi:hypothetical protein
MTKTKTKTNESSDSGRLRTRYHARLAHKEFNMKAWIGAVALAGTLASWTVVAADSGDGNQLITECANAVKAADGAKT